MNPVFEPLRKPLGQPVHLLPHPPSGGQGVGAGQLEDGDRDALGGVEPARHVGVLGPQLDPGHVGQPHDPAGPPPGLAGPLARLRLDDHLPEGRRVGQPAERGHRHLKVDLAGGGLLAELPRGDLHVLLAEGSDDIRRRQAAGGQGVGIEPDPHRVVAGAQEGDVPDAVEPRQGVPHLDQGVVAQVEQIEAAVG